MRQIDLETWPRKPLFDVFKNWEYPIFNICANLDITKFYPYIKENQIRFTPVVMYLIARTANSIPEFRWRIRPEGVVEHDLVHPSTTILNAQNLFSFCTVEFTQDFGVFAKQAEKRIAEVQQNPHLSDPDGSDHWLFMTSIPWVSFTSFMHPMQLNPADSVPRFAWGKLFEDGDRMKMPFSVQGHHAVMDGFHVGQYYQKIQEYLDEPQNTLRPGK